MKQNANPISLLAMLMIFALLACNDKAKKDEPAKTDETKTETETVTQPGYDPAMDPLKVAGYPARVLADSLGLKAYEFLAKPGDSIPMHSHPDHVIYVLEGGKAEITGKDGVAQEAEFKKDACMIFGPQDHSAKVTGATALKLLIVQVYRPRN